jgi:hypothetical protein
MICEACGGGFEPKKPNQKVCCAKCRKEKWRRAHAQDRDPLRGLIPEVADATRAIGRKAGGKVGRPIALTARVQRTVCRMVSAGNYLNVACSAAGISTDALSVWRKKGAAGEEPYAAFLAELQQAELDCESALVKKWHDAAPDDWRAARDLLARRFPDRWGREVEEMPPNYGPGLMLVLHLGGDDGELPERDRTVEIGDHAKRKSDIETIEFLISAPIKDAL